jgi:hypothetical protein
MRHLGFIAQGGSTLVLRHISRLLPCLVLVVFVAGAKPEVSASAPESARASKLVHAECCTVTYNAAKTHVQVTGVVAFRGRRSCSPSMVRAQHLSARAART